MQDAVEEDGDEKVVKEGFKIILLDGRHYCSATRQLNAEGRQEWTECPLHVTQVIYEDGQAVGEAEVMKSSRITNTSTAIVLIDRSLFSVMEVLVNHSGSFELQYVV